MEINELQQCLKNYVCSKYVNFNPSHNINEIETIGTKSGNIQHA